jgi:hypothetical protein
MRRLLHALLFVPWVLPCAFAGCSRTLAVATSQPNPILYPADTLRQSARLTIDVRDVDLPRGFMLRQSAYFAVVSRDRVRFHVSLVHKWEEVADIRTWHARLVDDRGNVYYPEGRETREADHLTRFWNEERGLALGGRTAQMAPPSLTGPGNVATDGQYIMGTDGKMHEVRMDQTTLSAVDVFQGNGDYVFHAPGLFSRHIKSLTLFLDRDAGTVKYQFTWHLTADAPPAPSVE